MLFTCLGVFWHYAFVRDELAGSIGSLPFGNARASIQPPETRFAVRHLKSSKLMNRWWHLFDLRSGNLRSIGTE